MLFRSDSIARQRWKTAVRDSSMRQQHKTAVQEGGARWHHKRAAHEKLAGLRRMGERGEGESKGV